MAKQQTKTKPVAKPATKPAVKPAIGTLAATVAQTTAPVASVAVVAPVVAKVAPVATVKPFPAYDTPMFYAAVLAHALGGFLGKNVQDFYQSAARYHAAAKHDVTWFVNRRAKMIADQGETLLTPEDVQDKMEYHKDRSIPNANTWSRRLYAEMRIQAAQSAK